MQVSKKLKSNLRRGTERSSLVSVRLASASSVEPVSVSVRFRATLTIACGVPSGFSTKLRMSSHQLTKTPWQIRQRPIANTARIVANTQSLAETLSEFPNMHFTTV